jgi:glucose 1-dehydrogenase
VTREAARIMRADEDRRGAIVMISSVHEVIPWERFSHYCASKGGMKLFAQSIAKELAPHGIRVARSRPGHQDPDQRAVLDDPEERGRWRRDPAGRWGEVSDIARAVAWVAPTRRSTSSAPRCSSTAG